MSKTREQVFDAYMDAIDMGISVPYASINRITTEIGYDTTGELTHIVKSHEFLGVVDPCSELKTLGQPYHEAYAFSVKPFIGPTFTVQVLIKK